MSSQTTLRHRGASPGRPLVRPSVLASSAGAAAFALSTYAGGFDGGTSASGPATVENRVKETELTTLKLTPQAETRLAIRTVAVERRGVPRTRTLPGDVVIPPGRSVVLAAPTAGLVLAADDSNAPPCVGTSVSAGQTLVRLLVGATSEGGAFAPSDRIGLTRARADLAAVRADAEGQVAQAQVRLDAARTKLTRAENLKRDSAGSQRAYDEAQTEADMALSALKAAQERLSVVSRIVSGLETGDESILSIRAPLAGVVRGVAVAPGQLVPGGAPLCEVYAPDPVWIRVPVYVGEFANLAEGAEAQVRNLADRAAVTSKTAHRIDPPGTADANSASIDLYYELANPDLSLRPGQRLGVFLAAGSATESLVVPRSAILFDVEGGTWVYENRAPQTYVRRRVEVRDVIGDLAVLARGPAAGTNVVAQGAVELFGTEFGSGK